MILSFVAGYLALNLVIGFGASRMVKNTQDFALAGRRLPFLPATAALFATWFGSETVLGASGEFMLHGLPGIIEEPFGAGLCLILVGLFFARPLYRLNVLTINDYFGICFGKKAEFLSALMMVFSFIGWVAAQFLALGFILETLTGIPLTYGLFLGAGIVVLYTVVGGMWAVSITDFIQTGLIIIGLIFLSLQLFEATDVPAMLAETPEGFFNFLPEANFPAVNEYVAAWITVGLGSVASQDVFQRVMSAKSEKIAVWASIAAGLMYLSISVMPMFAALCARFLYPELAENPQSVLLKMVMLHTPEEVRILFFGAILSAVMSTASGTILAPATVAGENLLRPFLSKEQQNNDAFMLKIMRLCVLLVAVLGLVTALFSGNIYALAGIASAFTLVSLFVPLCAALFLKSKNTEAAFAAMIVGFSVWAGAEFFYQSIPAATAGLAASAGAWFLAARLTKKGKK